MFVKEYFQNGKIQNHVPGAYALELRDPVLYRDENGGVGLMVKVVAYGEGEPGSKMRRPVEWVGTDKLFWKVENFAYFNQNELYKWHFGGWVYEIFTRLHLPP